MSFSPSNQPFKDDIELKSDLRSDTLDTRQEYDLKVRSHRCQKHLHTSVQEWLFFKILEKSDDFWSQISFGLIVSSAEMCSASFAGGMLGIV